MVVAPSTSWSSAAVMLGQSRVGWARGHEPERDLHRRERGFWRHVRFQAGGEVGVSGANRPDS